MAEYTPPPGSTVVSNHRLLSDFPSQLALHYLISSIIFIQYCLLVSPAAGWRARSIQLIALLCFPISPLVYQSINWIKLLKLLVQQRPRVSSLRHGVAGISGQRNSTLPNSNVALGGHHLLDVDRDAIEATILPYYSLRYYARAVLLYVGLITVGLHVDFYIGRLRVRYHGATYVAALGLDHRMGWLAMGSCAAAMFSIPIHLMNTQWTLRSKETLPTADKYAEDVMCVIVAAGVQDTLLALTNRPSTLGLLGLQGSLGLQSLCAIMVLGLGYKFRRWVPGGVISTVVLLWLVLVAMVQLVYDTKEVAEIQRGVYRPWNYRWAVKAPPWRSVR